MKKHIKRIIRTLLIWACFGFAFADGIDNLESTTYDGSYTITTLGDSTFYLFRGDSRSSTYRPPFTRVNGGGGTHNGGDAGSNWRDNNVKIYADPQAIDGSSRLNISASSNYLSLWANTYIKTAYYSNMNIRWLPIAFSSTYTFTNITEGDYLLDVNIECSLQLYNVYFYIYDASNVQVGSGSLVSTETGKIFNFYDTFHIGQNYKVTFNFEPRSYDAVRVSPLTPTNGATYKENFFTFFFNLYDTVEKPEVFPNLSPLTPPVKPNPDDFPTIDDYNNAVAIYNVQYTYYYNTTNNYYNTDDMVIVESSLTQPVEYFKGKGILAFPLEFLTGLGNAMRNGYAETFVLDVPEVKEPITNKVLISSQQFTFDPLDYITSTQLQTIRYIVSALLFASVAFAFYNTVYEGGSKE